MSLADTIYEASNGQQGEPTLLNTLVGLAMAKSIANRPDQFSIHQLHLRGDEIWHGYERVAETDKNVYVLTGYEQRIPQPLLYIFWSKLRTKLPSLNLDYIQISDNLLWDKKNGEIINLKEVYESQRTAQQSKESEEDGPESGAGLSDQDEMEGVQED